MCVRVCVCLSVPVFIICVVCGGGGMCVYIYTLPFKCDVSLIGVLACVVYVWYM